MEVWQCQISAPIIMLYTYVDSLTGAATGKPSYGLNWNKPRVKPLYIECHGATQHYLPSVKRQPLIGNTTKICAQLISQTSLSSWNSPLRPILGNPQFEPGRRDAVFRALGNSGLYQASHFSTMGRWKTITEFSDPGGLFRLDFLISLQLSHFLSSITRPNDTNQPPRLWKRSVRKPE